nr:unnamed protein product [Callosobruchus chinensis]
MARCTIIAKIAVGVYTLHIPIFGTPESIPGKGHIDVKRAAKASEYPKVYFGI